MAERLSNSLDPADARGLREQGHRMLCDPGPDRSASAIAVAPPRRALDGLERLMTLAFRGADLGPIASHLIERAGADEGDAEALMDLAVVLQLLGHRSLGTASQAQALTTQRLYQVRCEGSPRFRLLAIMAPGDMMTNTPLEFLVADSDIALSILYVTPDEPVPAQLPPCDAVFIAVAQSEPALPLLAALDAAAPRWGKPVINRPAAVPNTSRARAFEVLAGAPGIFIPATARLPRSALARLATGDLSLEAALPGAHFPLIARPVDSHAGQGLEKIDSTDDIETYLRAATAEEFFVAPFVDYRGGDGMFRKYRVVLVDGVAYPSHMAISGDWMIHYLNAGMTDSAAKRAEEERFMRDFRVAFAARHATALRALAERFALEYLVIDCGETRDGRLLVFEVCTGAVVHAMDPVDLFPYKRPHMEEIFAAFRSLVRRSAPAYLR
jgi:glutathione synthase/RimK-type ligase-like ATP-grasp enzyme